MDIALLSIAELAVPIVLGIAVTLYLRSVTWRVLVDLCGTQDRAAFWVKTIAVVTTLAPLVVVLVFARGPQSCMQGEAMCIAGTLRHTVALSLVALLIVVGCSANLIWSRIPLPNKPVETAKATS
jgi:protein-S-isoprenylcysteine O-methyltransferase Ste14